MSSLPEPHWSEWRLAAVGLAVGGLAPVPAHAGTTLAVTTAAAPVALGVALAGLAGLSGWLWLGKRQRQAALTEAALLKAALIAQIEARAAELQALEDELARTRAERNMAGQLSALGQVSVGLAQEFQPPLALLRTIVENTELEMVRGNVKNALLGIEKMSEMTRRMEGVLGDLHAFARLREAPAGAVDLGAVVQAALAQMQGRIAQAQVTVDWQAPDAPVLVPGGALRLQRALMSLIGYALAALSHCDDRRLRLRVQPEGEQGVLLLNHNGRQLDTPAQLFDPFGAEAQATPDGMGFGLALTQGLIHDLGGTLVAESPARGGASVVLRLPSLARAAH